MCSSDLHQHDGVLISGNRGAGKSTFLQILKHRIEEDALLKNGVLVLPILDPTLIDGDDVFLAAIVAAIWKAVKAELSQRPSSRGRHDDGPGLDELRKSLSKLARAMRVLDDKARSQILREAAGNSEVFAEQIIELALTGIDVEIGRAHV